MIFLTKKVLFFLIIPNFVSVNQYKHIIIYMKLVKLLLAMMLFSWIDCAAGTGLMREDYRTGQFTLYDNYFRSCKCSLVRGVDSAGVDVVLIALTLDEPELYVDACEEVTFVLRNAGRVNMHRVDKVRRGDVRYRRFKNVQLRYVTLYFIITWSQLEQLVVEESKVLILKIAGKEYRQNLKDVKHNIEKLHKELIDKDKANKVKTE